MWDKGKYILLLVAILWLQLFFILMQSNANSQEKEQLEKIYKSNILRNTTLDNIHATLKEPTQPLIIECE